MAEIKRLNYFTSQFLVEKDFTDEQAYHMKLRRRHNSAAHTFGVAEGLIVTRNSATAVSISPGTAVDSLGREIALESAQVFSLQNHGSGQDLFLTVTYSDVLDDADKYPPDPTKFIRTSERPVFLDTPTEPGEGPPPGPSEDTAVLLAVIHLNGSGAIESNASIDNTVRTIVGAKVAPLAIGTPQLADNAVTLNKLAANSVDATKIVDSSVGTAELAGLAVTNAKIAANAVDGGKIADNTIGNSKLIDGTIALSRLATQPVVSIQSVTAGAGGNIGLLKANAITVTTDTTAKTITIGESHSATTNNPHGTTAAQVGALPLTGGTISGTIQFQSITTTINDVSTSQTQNIFTRSAAKSKSMIISDENFGGNTSTFKTCLYVIPLVTGTTGITVDAGVGADSIVINGTARFNGTKIGYVVDTCVNASKTTLRTGDIVKLSTSGRLRFHGENNRIPIPEVVLADTAADPLVFGIVAQEATPSGQGPDTRTDPADPTSIPEGGELFVVTLGTFAHCKVEAEKEPIRVGDLLTSSAKKGYAKRATEPKIGTVIGKALEPLESGTGYIAVFVNIQ